MVIKSVKMWKFLIILAICSLHLTAAWKVLVVFAIPGKSHGILGEGYVRNLLKAGHEVTYITPFPKEKAPPNLHYVDVSGTSIPDNLLNITAILEKTADLGGPAAFEMLNQILEFTLSHKNVQNLMNDPKQEFDVVIAEWLFIEAYAGFADVFNCPFIWSSSVEPHGGILQLIDEIPNPSYTLGLQSKNSLPMNFLGRWKELASIPMTYLLRAWYVEGVENEIYEKYFKGPVAQRGRTLTPLNVLKYNASLVLGNSHVSLGTATRLPQSYKPIGGYHIEEETPALPEELKKLMDNSKHGVIYFSMGSNLKSKDLPDSIKTDLLKIFSELRQTVLWKFEEDLNNLPKNVRILKWAPQTSILAHPNCVLFITHGGLLSTTETIHYGVPIIGIPMFADQFGNIEVAVSKGFARKVELSYEVADELKAAIVEVTSNPKYLHKVKELSLIYHDRPASPSDDLTHWVAHVAKTKGALHLRSPALMVPWYFKLYLDLLAVVLVIVFAVWYVIKKVCCRGKKSGDSKKKKKN